MITKLLVALAAIILGLVIFTVTTEAVDEKGVTNRELDLFLTGISLGIIICIIMTLIILLL